jgi:hypothetical protein
VDIQHSIQSKQAIAKHSFPSGNQRDFMSLQLPSPVLICALLYDAVSSSDCIESNDTMINE